MQNKTSVLNTALMRVGAPVGNIDFQGTQAMQIADAAYQRCLDYCLSLYPWPFALKYKVLARTTSTPAFGWKYSYPLPGDCVRVLDVRGHDEEGQLPSIAWKHPGPKYEIADRNIYTDAESCALRYVSNDQQLRMDELFADALAWRVAFEISQYLPQGAANAQNYLQMFEQSLDRAKSESDAQEEPVRMQWDSKFLKERWVY